MLTYVEALGRSLPPRNMTSVLLKQKKLPSRTAQQVFPPALFPVVLLMPFAFPAGCEATFTCPVNFATALFLVVLGLLAPVAKNGQRLARRSRSSAQPSPQCVVTFRRAPLRGQPKRTGTSTCPGTFLVTFQDQLKDRSLGAAAAAAAVLLMGSRAVPQPHL